MKLRTLLLLALLAITPARAASPTPSASPTPDELWAETQKALSQNDHGRVLPQLQTLAAGGHVKAMLVLAQMYRAGNGVKGNWKTAQEWYEKAAAAGHSEAYWLIGQLYLDGGPELEKNWATAKDWLEKAAPALPEAYWVIGDLYYEGGPGLPKDLARACAYYRRPSGTTDKPICRDYPSP